MPVFDAAAAAAELDYSPFEFTGLDGELYELPNAKSLTAKQLQSVQTGDDTVLAELAPEAYEAMMQMPVGVTEQLGAAWFAQIEEVGKSPSASPKTPAVSKRSRQTSRSAGKTSGRSTSTR